MKVTTTPIEGLLIIEPRIFPDDRGYFYESYNKQKYVPAGIDVDFVQDNQSSSSKGTLRGLHAQAPPFGQGKLVRVTQGSVIDVALDIRKDSPTYGQHFTIKLSAENNLQFWIPEGFLHGFYTLEDDTVFMYKITNFYDKASEIGAKITDKDLGIDWGVEIGDDITLSAKDEVLPDFKDFVSPY
jgi:dTDP-4-dehydrorhamnose 3,5-epimerase